MSLANRFDNQFYVQGQSGGLTYYPFGGVLSGIKLSGAAASGSNVTVNMSAGQARLDTVLVDVAASALTLPAGKVLTTVGNDVVLPIYLNPIRKIPAVLTLPGSPAADDKVLLVTTMDANNQRVVGYKRYNGTVWVDFNPVQEPPNYNHNNHPMHDVINVAAYTGSQVSTTPEPVIYATTATPVYVYSVAAAYIRKSGSIKIGEVSVVAGTTPVVTVKGYPEDMIASI